MSISVRHSKIGSGYPWATLGRISGVGASFGVFELLTAFYKDEIQGAVIGLVLVSPLCRAPSWTEWFYNKEGIAVGRTFASLKNYQVDGNKEIVAIGVMNIAGFCTSCYVTPGSFSRTAVNYNAGAQSAVSNIVMASTLLVTPLFLMPLFHYTPNLVLANTPNLVLAAIIVTVVAGLIDYQAALKLWKVDKLDETN